MHKHAIIELCVCLDTVTETITCATGAISALLHCRVVNRGNHMRDQGGRYCRLQRERKLSSTAVGRSSCYAGSTRSLASTCTCPGYDLYPWSCLINCAPLCFCHSSWGVSNKHWAVTLWLTVCDPASIQTLVPKHTNHSAQTDLNFTLLIC